MPQLSEVLISAADPRRAAETFATICGGSPVAETGGANLRLQVGSASLVFVKDSTLQGVFRLTICLDEGSDHARTDASRTLVLNGLQIGFAAAVQSSAMEARRAHLDHVAICVHDLDAASSAWEALLGIRAVRMGIHPVSGGTFAASRLALDERMIELVSPVPGVPSVLAKRLASRGEGVVTLALPVADLGATLNRLSDMGVTVVNQPPHWMVHPRDAAGVLVQLTPRVEH